MQYLGALPTRNPDGGINTDAADKPTMTVLSKLYNISKYGRTINPMKSTPFMVGLVKDFMDESHIGTLAAISTQARLRCSLNISLVMCSL